MRVLYEHLASTRAFWWGRCCSSVFFVFCGLFLLCLSSVCVLCTQCYQFFWTVSSVFSTVYLLPKLFHVSYVPNVTSFSEYFILDCPFGVLQRLFRIEIAFMVSIISFVNTHCLNELYLHSCYRWMSVQFLFGRLKYLQSNFCLFSIFKVTCMCQNNTLSTFY